MAAKSSEKLVAQTEEDIEDIRWVNPKDLSAYTSQTYPSIVDVLNFAE